MDYYELENLIDSLVDPAYFAENYCGWDSSEYYDSCYKDEDGNYYPLDYQDGDSDYSINDAAAEAIRNWVVSKPKNLPILRRYVSYDY